jgi:hypothetical protein
VLDDDGEVYYSGWASGKHASGAEEFVFEPLDFARRDAGATELQHLEPGPDGVGTQWVTV